MPLTATLRVWLAHCQKMTLRRLGLGMSIPAWGISTAHDERS